MLLTGMDIAESTGVTRMSVWYWAQRGELAFKPVGVQRVYPVRFFLDFLARELAAPRRARWLRKLAGGPQGATP